MPATTTRADGDRVTANLPARDLGETEAFYRALGFDTVHRDDGRMILARGALEIELFPRPDLVPGDSRPHADAVPDGATGPA